MNGGVEKNVKIARLIFAVCHGHRQDLMAITMVYICSPSPSPVFVVGTSDTMINE